MALSGCKNLVSITIPNSVTGIYPSAFLYCESLDAIHFRGTQAEWDAIAKMSNWNDHTGNYTVYCTDGEIYK